MNELNVNIENCYGINLLNEKFEFDSDINVYAIYAPNGVMKTSFAKIFDDFCKGRTSSDLIFQDKISKVKIEISENTSIAPESIFVIHPYDKSYKSDKMSNLLINENLKLKYDKINNEIEDQKNRFLNELKIISKSSKSLETDIALHFMNDSKAFLPALIRAKSDLLKLKVDYSNIPYESIFDENILSFLQTGNIKKEIKEYIMKYNEMIESSNYLSKDFNHYNAETIQKNLDSNGFFKAKHSINLKKDGVIFEVMSAEELMNTIKAEKDNVLNSSELQKIFERIDKKIKNSSLRDFRQFLFENQEILVELENVEEFREKVLLSYFSKCEEIYTSLCNNYLSSLDEINKIIETANLESTKWENVIKIFNSRFYVPFKLELKNKHETILNRSVPSLLYRFKDKNDVTEDLIMSVLSQGERRALYLLNILFEIESRKSQDIETLYIIDDIADSFDYKNKYAIVEYLKEISQIPNFKSIILTHNFDFYRTIQERIGMNKYENSLMAIKSETEIKLEKVKYKYICNPFKVWKKDLADNAKFIASLTFARNICEYIGNNNYFEKLTSLLHKKSDTTSILVCDIENIYKEIFSDLNDLDLENKTQTVYKLIEETASNLVEEDIDSGLNLENKIVLSIAIRLKAEEFMINKINEPIFVEKLKNNQTGKLFGKFKEKFNEDNQNIEILDRVNIMTPENIHLNSFMFEPILDMSDEHLKNLYKTVCLIN